MRVHSYALNKMILQILFLINVNAFFFLPSENLCRSFERFSLETAD